jgi:hypothetical protein
LRERWLSELKLKRQLIGVMRDDFDAAMDRAALGVLVVGPPEIAAQVAAQFPSAQVFALKGPQMELSEHLQTCERSGQLHRIDVDVAPGAWTDVHTSMAEIIGLPLKA